MSDDLEPTDAPFAHTEVRASFPQGTDPKEAIREAMTVFMERTDGTNVLEWWQQIRWWHAGPRGLRRGDRVLPPAETGVYPGISGTDVNHVYITSSRGDALLYCARHGSPLLYEVTIYQEPLFDDVMPTVNTSGRVPMARVYRIEYPSHDELSQVWAIMQQTSNSFARDDPGTESPTALTTESSDD